MPHNTDSFGPHWVPGPGEVVQGMGGFPPDEALAAIRAINRLGDELARAREREAASDRLLATLRIELENYRAWERQLATQDCEGCIAKLGELKEARAEIVRLGKQVERLEADNAALLTHGLTEALIPRHVRLRVVVNGDDVTAEVAPANVRRIPLSGR